MKILLSSYVFPPSVGGIEIVSAMLAEEFHRQGHEVKVVTLTDGPDGGYPFEVVRRPGALRLLGLARWCDVFFQNNISLKTVWPWLLVRRPLVVTHQVWLEEAHRERGVGAGLKQRVLKGACNIAISNAVARTMRRCDHVIANPYRDGMFRPPAVENRDREIVFVGRLVSDKGCEDLILSVIRLAAKGIRPRVTVVGTGPEAQRLNDLARSGGVADQVEFVGGKSSAELSVLLPQHQIMVVPSRWMEPFGIVAVEGVASGCVVVGTSGGGLPEAIGPCGPLYPNGDVEALTTHLEKLLGDPELVRSYRSHAAGHLARFRLGGVARNYLGVFEGLCPRDGGAAPLHAVPSQGAHTRI